MPRLEPPTSEAESPPLLTCSSPHVDALRVTRTLAKRRSRVSPSASRCIDIHALSAAPRSALRTMTGKASASARSQGPLGNVVREAPASRITETAHAPRLEAGASASGFPSGAWEPASQRNVLSAKSRQRVRGHRVAGIYASSHALCRRAYMHLRPVNSIALGSPGDHQQAHSIRLLGEHSIHHWYQSFKYQLLMHDS